LLAEAEVPKYPVRCAFTLPTPQEALREVAQPIFRKCHKFENFLVVHTGTVPLAVRKEIGEAEPVTH
jgi:hypothetical protein